MTQSEQLYPQSNPHTTRVIFEGAGPVPAVRRVTHLPILRELTGSDQAPAENQLVELTLVGELSDDQLQEQGIFKSVN